jgi:hypothetical protein
MDNIAVEHGNFCIVYRQLARRYFFYVKCYHDPLTYEKMVVVMHDAVLMKHGRKVVG